MFIPIGVGGVASAMVTGRVIDWNFKRYSRRLQIPMATNEAQDLANFPIAKARLELGFPLYLAMATLVILYGWLLELRVSIAGLIVVLFATSFVLSGSMQVLSTLMVDLWPGRSAAATAANNLFRCEVGAAASAAIQPMIQAMGRGWAYTTLALISAASTPFLVLVVQRHTRKRAEGAETERDCQL